MENLGIEPNDAQAAIVAELHDATPHGSGAARALFDLIVVKEVKQALGALTSATVEHTKVTSTLVQSSNQHTDAMSRLGRTQGWLTFALVAFAALQIVVMWWGYHSPPPPAAVNVDVPPPVVEIIHHQPPAPADEPTPAPTN